jgi:hypothetical protein
MYSPDYILQNIVLSLIESSGNLGQQVAAYIDPNTMHHVFSFFGPLLAFFAAVAGMVISVIFFLRHHIVSWFKKVSGIKFIAVLLVLVLIVTGAIVVAYKLILCLITY